MAVTTTRRVHLAVTVLAMLGLALRAEAAGPKKIDQGLSEALQGGAPTQHVIITVKGGYRSSIRKALEQHGDLIKSDHPLINALSGEVHSEDVAELAGRDEIVSIALDAEVSADGLSRKRGERWSRRQGSAASDFSLPPQRVGRPTRCATRWAFRTSRTCRPREVRTALAWPSLTPVLSRVPTLARGSPASTTTSHVTGGPRGRTTTSAMARTSPGSSPAAASCRISSIRASRPTSASIGLKVLDSQGQGKTSDVISALEFVTANKSRLNIQIVNLSLGHPIFAPASDDPLVQAVQKATAAGLIVITSAGNNGQNADTGQVGYAGVTSPCNAPSAICVGAAMTQNTVQRDDDVVAPYSSRGPSWYDGFAKPDLIAPGHKLVSDTNTSSYLYQQLPNAQCRPALASRCLSLSGTSMAAAVASGVAALVLDAQDGDGHGVPTNNPR